MYYLREASFRYQCVAIKERELEGERKKNTTTTTTLPPTK